MEIPEGYAQANFIHTGSAVPTGAQWTLGLDVSNYAGDANECAESLRLAYIDAVMGGYNANTCVLSGISVKFGPTLTGPSGFAFAAVAGLGGSAGGQPQVSYLIHKTTAFGGRAGRGRVYMPGVMEGFVNESGVVATEALEATQEAWTDFGAKLDVDLLPPVLLHGESSPITTPSPITAFVVDAQVATQRRRNRR